jgi:glutathione S-transferase
MTTLLPPDYGYVFGGLFLTGLANFYLVINVAIRRKKFGISYPALYADSSHISKECKKEDVMEFNCAQRAHQNTCEGIAGVQLLGVVNGLLFPRFSAGCLAFYALGRVIYGYGYVSGGPDGRMAGGIITHLGDFPLLFCSLYSAATLLGYV